MTGLLITQVLSLILKLWLYCSTAGSYALARYLVRCTYADPSTSTYAGFAGASTYAEIFGEPPFVQRNDVEPHAELRGGHLQLSL